jgi:hypothetical protein
VLRYIGTLCALVCALALAGDAYGAPVPPDSPSKGSMAPWPVSLTDARTPPTAMAYVPGVMRPVRLQRPASVALGCPTGARPTDVSAYRWNGRALGAQTFTPDGSMWQVKRGRYNVGAVTYERRTGTFTNESARPVLVAIWCD